MQRIKTVAGANVLQAPLDLLLQMMRERVPLAALPRLPPRYYLVGRVASAVPGPWAANRVGLVNCSLFATRPRFDAPRLLLSPCVQRISLAVEEQDRRHCLAVSPAELEKRHQMAVAMFGLRTTLFGQFVDPRLLDYALQPSFHTSAK